MKPLYVSTLLVLWFGLSAAATTSVPVRAEIDALLSRLQASGCQFNRNGTWYSAPEAKGHLLRKLEYIEGRGTITSTEQFIELAASRSSSSGKAYQVRCGGESPVQSKQWLTDQLKVLRSSAIKGNS